VFFEIRVVSLGNQIVQCGNEKIRFYSIYGRNISYQDALLTNRAKVQPFLSLGWIGGNIVVGTADGSLYRFLGFNLEGEVFSLLLLYFPLNLLFWVPVSLFLCRFSLFVCF
jgi:hypothetical protein